MMNIENEEYKQKSAFKRKRILFGADYGHGLGARCASVTGGSDSHLGCHSTPPLSSPSSSFEKRKRKSFYSPFHLLFGADYGARTRHLNLGKVALYQMS